MQFTTVRSKEKDYDIYLKSEKLVHSQQEHEKSVSQLFGSGKNWFLAIIEPDKKCTVAAIWRFTSREKSGSLLFGDQKMQFTTVRSKEKDYDIYLKSEKLVHSQQEQEKIFFTKKMFPSYLEVEKTGSQLISNLTNKMLQLFGERNKWIPAIWRPKNVVHNLLGARKKIMTSI